MQKLRRQLKWVRAIVTVILVIGVGFWLLGAFKSWMVPNLLRRAAARWTAKIFSVTPTASVIVERLQAINRLETARQVSHHVVEVSVDSPWLPSFLGGERVLMVAQAEAIAGVDLQHFSENDVQVTGDRVVLHLPPPKILSVRLDETKSRVYARERGWLVFNPDKDLERRARLQAYREASQAARQSELLSVARRNAEVNLQAFLQALGFRQVTVQWKSPSHETQPRLR